MYGIGKKWNKQICKWIATVLEIALLVNQFNMTVSASEQIGVDILTESGDITGEENNAESAEVDEGEENTETVKNDEAEENGELNIDDHDSEDGAIENDGEAGEGSENEDEAGEGSENDVSGEGDAGENETISEDATEGSSETDTEDGSDASDIVENGSEKDASDSSESDGEGEIVVSRTADVVFVIDVSSSMGSYINKVKEKIAEFIGSLNDDGVDVRIKFVLYSDFANSEKTVCSEWCSTVEDATTALNNIKMLGGGDYEETPLDGMGFMFQDDFGWRDSIAKFSILLTDAPYKEDNTFGYTFEGITDELEKNGIVSSVIVPNYNTVYDEWLVNGGKKADIGSDFGFLLDWVDDVILPGGATVHNVTIEVKKDNELWSGHGRNFILQNLDKGFYIKNFKAIEDGNYRIYDIASGVYLDTRESITVAGGDVKAVVNYYTVTFYDGDNAYDETSDQAPQIVLNGQTASQPNPPEKPGNPFIEWVTENNGTAPFDFSQGIGGTTSVYARWSLYSVDIKVQKDSGEWEGHGKTFNLKKKDTDATDTWITNLTAVEAGTYQIYEVTASGGYLDTRVRIEVDEKNVEAEVNYYTVTFYNDDTVFARQIVLENAKVSAPSSSPTKDGYDFYRWVTSYGGSTEFDFVENSITARTDIYASWTWALTVRFYSGMENELEVSEVTLEEGDDSALIRTPKVKDMAGWTALGWNTAEDKFNADIEAETEVRIFEDTEYYGIYKKDITLSYDINYTPEGVIEAPDSQTKTAYANVHQTTSHIYPEFTIAGELTRRGYTFDCWHTAAEEDGVSYAAGSEAAFEEDTILYAHWVKNGSKVYKVEHYCQNLVDDGYTRMDSDTQEMEEIIGETVTAQPKNYEGFTENTKHSERVASGIIEKDSELTLKLYYDRNVYQVDFDLNYTHSGGGSVVIPQMQTLRYGAKLSSVITPERRGWSFKGWYKSREAANSVGGNMSSDMSSNVGSRAAGNGDKITDGILDDSPWNFDSTIEDNIDLSELSSVTLYARWVDDIEPLLDNASYNTGYKDLAGWIIRKKDLIITVPVTEEGSGADTAEYTLIPDNGNSVSGVTHIESAYVPRQVRHDESVQLYTGGNTAETATENTTASIRWNVENDQVSIVITISEDYKGKIYLKCNDKAGNNSGQKNLTIGNNGVIVEDNAPKISFLTGDVQNGKVSVKVSVSDEDDKDGNSYITGGIAGITYQIDDGEPEHVTYKEVEIVEISGGGNGNDLSNDEGRENNEDLENDIDFQSNIVTACDFKVEISGAGTHNLSVTAVDNAGNENSQNTEVSIAEEKNKKQTSKKKTTVAADSYTAGETSSEFTYFVQTSKPPMTQNGEPGTGDTSMRVEVYATVAMIAGLLYIFLYFCSGKNGMTEHEKNEVVSRLVAWAKGGRKYRRYVAIAMIFGVLFYYHSIGKRMDVEWNEVLER